jgi:tyrosine-specific transport protein
MIVIMGVVERESSDGLLALMSSDHATSGLTAALSKAVQNNWIHGFFEFFTSICILTAFLGVSLGLFDFLADGLKLKKKGKQGFGVLALTFLPPLGVVLVNPGIYLRALSYAGVCCIIFLLLLPVLMAWQGRKKSSQTTEIIFFPGGNAVLFLMAGIAICLLSVALFF